MYFVYKLNHIPQIGGAMPITADDGDMGLAVYGDWYLGRCVDPTFLDTIREFTPFPCSDEVAQGFRFLGVDTVLEGEEERPLTGEEIAFKTAAQMFVAKLVLRPTIETQVGDSPDQMADMAKRVALLERAVIHIYGYIKHGTEIPAGWTAILEQFASDLSVGDIQDPVDIRPDGYEAIYAKLRERSNTLTGIMSTYY